jgi:nucleotide-binding universal stress UspA family protein
MSEHASVGADLAFHQAARHPDLRENRLARPLRRIRRMTSSEPTHVIVAYDFSRSAKPALTRAIALAKRDPAVVLHFVCVVAHNGSVNARPPYGQADYAYAECVRQTLTDVVGDELRSAAIPERIQFHVHARIGQAADEILTLARETGADVIVLGTKSRTRLESPLQGSVSERVVREAGCTVEIARSKPHEHASDADSRRMSQYIPPFPAAR